MNQPVRAWIIWPLVGLQILLIVLVAVLDTLSLPASAMANQSLAAIWSFAFAVVMNLNFGLVMDLAIGALIFWRRPEHPIGWLFCLEDLGWTINNIARAYVTYALVAHSGALPAPEMIIWFYDWPVFISVGLFLFLILLFPTGRLPSPRWRLLAWFVVAWIAVGTVGAAFKPGPVNPIQGISMDNPAGIAGPVGQFLAQCYNFAQLLIVPLTLVTAASTLLRLRRAQGLERQQLKWFTSAMVVVAVCYSANGILLAYYDTQAAMPLWVYVVYSISMMSGMLIPVAAGIAILRYHLFDIDVVINRTLVYGMLTLCVVGGYALLVALLGQLFQARGSFLVSLAGTGLVALAFQPLRNRLQRMVNRLMYGQRDEPYQALSQLGQRLESTFGPEAVLTVIVETIAAALKLPAVAIAISQNDSERVAATAGNLADTAHQAALPLTYQGETVGRLLLAPRRGERSLSPTDRRLLDDLARQAGIAVHAVRLSSDLQHSRERLVTAREEERRRLRRDLHDGLGPTLASIAQRIELAAALITTDPARSTALLHELEGQVRATIGDIRRLVYDLRPPTLDQHGLAGAIRAEVGRWREGALQVSLEAVEPLPPLPAAVEVAAYRIMQEAMTNVVRHAQAQHCSIRLRPAADATRAWLAVEVADDGRGLPAEYRAGVGLNAMRERVEELGGTWLIESNGRRGTRVSARLPLPREEE